MPELDPIIHQSARLRIMAALVALPEGDKVDFGWLRDRLGLTDGNLGAHLIKLEEQRYIIVEKTFVGRKPRTYVQVSHRGRAAFDEHALALEEIIQGREIDSS